MNDMSKYMYWIDIEFYVFQVYFTYYHVSCDVLEVYVNIFYCYSNIKLIYDLTCFLLMIFCAALVQRFTNLLVFPLFLSHNLWTLNIRLLQSIIHSKMGFLVLMIKLKIDKEAKYWSLSLFCTYLNKFSHK